MAFVQLENAMPLSHRHTNMHWCEMAANKICMVYHTEEDTPKVFLQTAIFDNVGNVTLGPVVFVATMQLNPMFSFLRCCKIDDDHIAVVIPVAAIDRVHTSSDRNTSVPANTLPSINTINVVRIADGLVLSSVQHTSFVYASQNNNNDRTGQLEITFSGTTLYVMQWISHYHTSNLGVFYPNVHSYAYTLGAEYILSSTSTKYTSTFSSYGAWGGFGPRGNAARVKKGVLQGYRASIDTSGIAGTPERSWFYEPVAKVSTLLNVANLYVNTNGTLLVNDKVIQASNVNAFDLYAYPSGTLAKKLYAGAYIANFPYDMDILPNDVVVRLDSADQSPNHFVMADLEALAMGYTVSTHAQMALLFNKYYPDASNIVAPPAQIEKQVIPYYMDSVARYPSNIIFPYSENAFALIGCFSESPDTAIPPRPSIITVTV